MVMRPVLEFSAADDFVLWPVGEHESFGYLVLNGELTPAEVGTAVMRIADCNDFEPEEEHGPCPTDPLGAFLHGLLTMPDLFAAGGLRVTTPTPSSSSRAAATAWQPGGTGWSCSTAPATPTSATIRRRRPNALAPSSGSRSTPTQRTAAR